MLDKQSTNQKMVELEKDAIKYLKQAAKKGYTAMDISKYTYILNKKAKETSLVGSLGESNER